ncbi:unnamed protein product, partial [marine sediment metagenome]
NIFGDNIGTNIFWKGADLVIGRGLARKILGELVS